MFTFLRSTLGTVCQDSQPVTSFKRGTVSAVLFAATMTLGACQQQTTEPNNSAEKSSSQQSVEEDKAAKVSASAAERIEQFQPLYVQQMEELQRRLQAEFEALQAADMSDTPTDNAAQSQSKTDPSGSVDNEAELTTVDNQAKVADKPEVNTSTQVGERDLQVLKRVTLDPRQPQIVTTEVMTEHYKQALDALYESASTPLSAQNIDTLLNIASLTPQLYEHPEIADRVNVKSPALARFIIQQQVTQQIEAQQALDMQQLKVAQQQEFEKLIAKFDETIKGYDEQIAKYKQTLEEFQ